MTSLPSGGRSSSTAVRVPPQISMNTRGDVWKSVLKSNQQLSRRPTRKNFDDFRLSFAACCLSSVILPTFVTVTEFTRFIHVLHLDRGNNYTTMKILGKTLYPNTFKITIFRLRKDFIGIYEHSEQKWKSLMDACRQSLLIHSIFIKPSHFLFLIDWMIDQIYINFHNRHYLL